MSRLPHRIEMTMHRAGRNFLCAIFFCPGCLLWREVFVRNVTEAFEYAHAHAVACRHFRAFNRDAVAQLKGAEQ